MNFVICDDNVKEVVLIRRILEENFYGCRIEEFYDGNSIVKYFQFNVPDVILLDVEMPGMNGIETARRIRDINGNIGIIFITGHTQFALEAFGVYAFDYIVKPVRKERLIASINKVLGKTDFTEEFIEINYKKTLFRVNQKEILFIEKAGHKSYIHTEKFIYTMRAPIHYFINRLNKEIFTRTHSGFIVNRNKIASITPKGNMAYDIHFESTDKTASLSRGMNEILKLI